MLVVDQEGKLFCEIEISTQPSANFVEANHYVTSAHYIVFIFRVDVEEDETFIKELLHNSEKLFFYTRYINRYASQSGHENFYYVGFRGLHKSHHVVTQFLNEYRSLEETNQVTFAQLRCFNEILINRMDQRLRDGVLVNTDLVKTDEPDIIERKSNGKVRHFTTLKLRQGSSHFIQKLIDTPVNGTSPVEIETFNSILFRFISGNRGPIVLPVYTEDGERIGTLSEKYPDFQSLQAYLTNAEHLANRKKNPSIYQQAVETLATVHHDAITAIMVACYGLGDGNCHYEQIGFSRGQLAKIDSEDCQPLTSKYRRFSPNEVRKSGDRTLPPPSQSYPVTEQDVHYFPHLQDTHFYHWFDNRAFRDFNLIQISEHLGHYFNARHFHFLMLALLPACYVERLAKHIFTSAKAADKFSRHLIKRFREISKHNFSSAAFAEFCLSRTHLHQEIEVYIDKFNQQLSDFCYRNQQSPANGYVGALQISAAEKKIMLVQYQYILTGLKLSVLNNRLIHSLPKENRPGAIPSLVPAAFLDDFVSGVGKTQALINPAVGFIHDNRSRQVPNVAKLLQAYLRLFKDYVQFCKQGVFTEFSIEPSLRYALMKMERLNNAAVHDKVYCIALYNHIKQKDWSICRFMIWGGVKTVATTKEPARLLSSGQVEQCQVIERAFAAEISFSEARRQVNDIGYQRKLKGKQPWYVLNSSRVRQEDVANYYEQFDATDDSDVQKMLGLNVVSTVVS